jgi:hypothetical protein
MWTCDRACETARRERRSIRTIPRPAARVYARIDTEGLEDEMPSITREDARPRRVPWLDRNPWWAGVIAGAALVTVLWICNEFRP